MCWRTAGKLIETIVPHVTVVMTGKENTQQKIESNAIRGAHTILLANTGPWVNRLVRSVKQAQSPSFKVGTVVEAEMKAFTLPRPKQQSCHQGPPKVHLALPISRHWHAHTRNLKYN